MQGFSLADLLRIAYHRRWWLLVPIVCGLALGVTAYELLPPMYRASTVIVAHRQRVPSDFVRPTVTDDTQERIKTVEQSIRSREALVPLIEELHLYPKKRGERGLEDAIDEARSAITVQIVGSNVLRIYFRAGSPTLAARAANGIADRFIGTSSTVREQQARGTSAFLGTEVDALRRRLGDQEARIADFKSRHVGELPEDRDALLHEQESLQAKLRDTQQSIDQAELLRSELGNEQARRAPAVAPDGRAAAVDPQAKLAQLRDQLADLRSRYTEEHPDVIRARKAVEQMEARLRSEPAPASGGAPAAAASGDPELASIDRNLAALRATRTRTQQDLAALTARLDGIPRVEQDLQALTRDYDNLRTSYQSLLTKRVDAQVAENLELRQQAEPFTILERAVPPRDPYFPNLLLLLAVGACAGALCGIGAAALREQTDQTYADEESLRRDFARVPLLATIPLLGAAAGAERVELKAAGRKAPRAS